MKAVYRIADLNIQIESVYAYVHNLCSKYRFDGVPDLSVRTSQQDIDRERLLQASYSDTARRLTERSTDPYIESLAVYRRIANIIPAYNGFVFHGSAVAVDHHGYIFTAKSGTGKTTHTDLWLRLLGDRARVVNGDKPIIRFIQDQACVYGTPYKGKEHYGDNISVPLKAICILERSEENKIREITKFEALPMLLQQTYRPEEAQMMERTLSLLDGLSVKLYRLGCNMNIEAARVAYEAMRGTTL